MKVFLVKLENTVKWYNVMMEVYYYLPYFPTLLYMFFLNKWQFISSTTLDFIRRCSMFGLKLLSSVSNWLKFSCCLQGKYWIISHANTPNKKGLQSPKPWLWFGQHAWNAVKCWSSSSRSSMTTLSCCTLRWLVCWWQHSLLPVITGNWIARLSSTHQRVLVTRSPLLPVGLLQFSHWPSDCSCFWPSCVTCAKKFAGV